MSSTDDDIRAMLAARAGRATVGGTQTQALLEAARARAAAEPRRPRGRFGLPLGVGVPRVVGGLASLAAVALVAVFVALPLTARPPASEAPTAAASSVPGATEPPASPSASPLPEARVLTAAELGSLVEARGSETRRPHGRGRRRIGARSIGAVPRRNDLRERRFSPAPAPRSSSKPVGDIGPGPWAGSGPKAGTFAMRLTDSRDATGERLIVEYLGDILPAADRLAWSVDDLAAGEAREGGGRDWAVFKGYVAVRGWLVRTPLRSCPSIARAPANGLVGSAPVYGCPTDDWLTSAQFQPLRDDGSSIGPAARDEHAERELRSVGTGARRRSGLASNRAKPRISWSHGALVDAVRSARGLLHRPGAFRLAGTGSSRSRFRRSGAEEPYGAGDRHGLPPGRDSRSRSTASRCLVGLDTQLRLAEATDDTPFLAGGFSWHGPIICSGGIGFSDPNPLGARGCASHDIAGVPGELFVATGRIDARRRAARRSDPHERSRRGDMRAANDRSLSRAGGPRRDRLAGR